MKYVILGEDAKEYGPIDGETLRKWVESGRVLPHTQVRNALLKTKWGRADKLEFLQDAFAVLGEKRFEEAGILDRLRDLLFHASGGKREPKPKNTAFRHSYVPQPASAVLRLLAFIADGVVLTALAGGFAIVFWLAVKAGYGPNPAFQFLGGIYVLCVLLYYGVALGTYAQTAGMWFWGIMLAKQGEEADDLEEAYPLRAYSFALAMFVLGALTPLCLILPRQRAIHDLLTGCVVVGIAAKPKA
jgi:uncharacterized RDD family membrane protein YckC